MQIDTANQSSPFHRGEIAIQKRLGVHDKIDKFARQVVRAEMPDQHRQFYQQLAFILAGHVDQDGWPWASILVGKPGFVASADSKTLTISANPFQGDPLAQSFRPGLNLGLLGLEPHTRRRNRVNGKVAAMHDGVIQFNVDQSFGNCPQYIQTRELTWIRNAYTTGDRETFETLGSLDQRAIDMIRSADTFFVASHASNVEGSEAARGADVSHRGGRQGFVDVDGEAGMLTIPDFAGNNHFNTLGNLAINPKAGLLFVDFETGDLLMLTGTTEIIWEGPEIQHFAGAERAWRVHIKKAIRLIDALPFRLELDEFSPNSMLTGTWDEARSIEKQQRQKNAWRDFRIKKIEAESPLVRSFYLEPVDGEAILPYEAGQHLTLRIPEGDGGRPLIRNYTLSSAPADDHYRISIKHEKAADNAPEGRMSGHMHKQVKAGDIVQIRSPRGNFVFDAMDERPAVLIAGGIGITPMISMARHAAIEALRRRKLRPLTVFHATTTSEDRPFINSFRQLEQASQGLIRHISIVSRPQTNGRPGIDFDHAGRISPAILKHHLPLDDYQFFLCGPGPFMQAIYDMLRGLGVQDTSIEAEAFGPSSLQRAITEQPSTQNEIEEASDALVAFEITGSEHHWQPKDGTLLEFAEAHALAPAYGCRAGQCGSCVVKVKQGSVAYRTPTTATIDEGEALICCAVPAKGSDRLILSL